MTIARDIAAWVNSTISKQGPIELATQAEIDAENAANLLTPKTLADSTELPGGLIDVQVFTANGTWTKPAGCKTIEVYCVGGGGGGAGVNVTNVLYWKMGGAGGGGGSINAWFDADDFGSTVTVAAGAAGAGGAAGDNDGATGGNSSFNGTSGSYYCYASGGTRGRRTLTNDKWGISGGGGSSFSAGHTVRIRTGGGAGGGGYVAGGGFAGSTGGGVRAMQSNAYAAFSVATSGSSPGGDPTYLAKGEGGGGAVVAWAVTSRAGYAGKAGFVVVKSYS